MELCLQGWPQQRSPACLSPWDPEQGRTLGQRREVTQGDKGALRARLCLCVTVGPPTPHWHSQRRFTIPGGAVPPPPTQLPVPRGRLPLKGCRTSRGCCGGRPAGSPHPGTILSQPRRPLPRLSQRTDSRAAAGPRTPQARPGRAAPPGRGGGGTAAAARGATERRGRRQR